LSVKALEDLAYLQQHRGNQTAVATLEQVLAEVAEAERNLTLEQRVARLEALMQEKGGQE
jgi:hypothetical protein